MMSTTHAIVGLAVAIPVAAVTGDHAPLLLWAGLLGGAFPDLDLYSGFEAKAHGFSRRMKPTR